jgi:hypothetical protein
MAHDPDGAPVHVRWLQQSLELGQQITPAIDETEQADPLRRATVSIRHGPSDANASTMSDLSAKMVMLNAVRLLPNARMQPTGRSDAEPRRAARSRSAAKEA